MKKSYQIAISENIVKSPYHSCSSYFNVFYHHNYPPYLHFHSPTLLSYQNFARTRISLKSFQSAATIFKVVGIYWSIPVSRLLVGRDIGLVLWCPETFHCFGMIPRNLLLKIAYHIYISNFLSVYINTKSRRLLPHYSIISVTFSTTLISI